MAGRDIPDPVKRQLRQEAGFGCCACGYPFIEYHHIIPFSDVPHHNPKDMMVLCPIHHHQVTGSAVNEMQQRRWQREPFNVLHGFAHGTLLVKDPVLAVESATILFVGAGFKFLVDGAPLLQIRADQDNRLLISLELYDEQDQRLLLVVDNEWITGDPQPWDFEFSENVLKLRRKERDLRLTIDARSVPLKVSGSFWRHGQNFATSGEWLYFNAIAQKIGFAHLGLVGISLEANTFKKEFALVPYPKIGGMFVSWPDPTVRLTKSIEAYNRLLHSVNLGRNEICPCGSGRKWKHCCGA